MAGTHYYFNVMSKETKIEILGILFGLFCCIVTFGPVIAFCCIVNDDKTSSPVEDIQHKELVATLDSIFDARFGPGCCEEVIDSDDVSVPHDSFGRVILPDNY